MASSRHNGKNASSPSAAARSASAGQDEAGSFLTTAQGLRLPDTDHSLKAGQRGPTLLEDFHLPRRSPTSITSGFPSASSMPAAPPRTASSSRTAPAGR